MKTVKPDEFLLKRFGLSTKNPFDLASCRYSDHPMCAELLNTQLPETSRRTPVQAIARVKSQHTSVLRGSGYLVTGYM